MSLDVVPGLELKDFVPVALGLVRALGAIQKPPSAQGRAVLFWPRLAEWLWRHSRETGTAAPLRCTLPRIDSLFPGDLARNS